MRKNTKEENMKKEELESKIEELAEVLREGRANADQIMLPSESQSNAAYLERKAISLVEEITGETWEFSYLSFF